MIAMVSEALFALGLSLLLVLLLALCDGHDARLQQPRHAHAPRLRPGRIRARAAPAGLRSLPVH